MANSLGNRLAAVANKHSKLKNWRSTLKTKLNEARSNNSFREPVYSMGAWQSAPAVEKKNCGPKPQQWLGMKKNPAFEEWKACSTGGKQKTRKSKKSRRVTRRRR